MGVTDDKKLGAVVLEPHERQRLLKILGMLASSHAGERAAAGLAAARFLQDRNLQWDNLILHVPKADATELSDLCLCRKYGEKLTQWEVNFVHGLVNWRGQPSANQNSVLAGIAARLRNSGLT